ncbi:ABC transporter substrate-binding protein [Advenella kashmirensis W13003]|uniref:ABC transporter substrate-binding protein n=1 Tax=Advenella kashmirensis W13003 TaxID=1424334 RepID=V8QKX9_9BURK|nr:ABC transporter substrate-binding protein [Advenella kashmirensis W13003]
MKFTTLILLCMATMGPPAHASEHWPQRPITFVVPYPPGGTSDIVARIVANRLSETIKQSVVVENRPGANGNIGANIVAKSKPDGYTFLLCDVSALAVSPTVYKSLTFNPETDLTSVAMLSFSPFLLVTNPALHVSTLRALVEKSKGTNADFNFAATSIGSISHLTGLEIKQKTGAIWQDVFYKGGSEAISDTIAGHTQLLIAGIPVLAPHIQSGKLTALGVTSASRIELMPNVPSLEESGIKGLEVGAWQGIFGPRQTPNEVVSKLNSEINNILQLPDVQNKFKELGADTKPMSVEQVNTLFRDEAKRWSSVIKNANLKF